MIMLGYKETFRLLSVCITVSPYRANQLQTNYTFFFFFKFQDQVQQECIVEESLNAFYSHF